MKAAVLVAPKTFAVRTVPRPQPGPGEVLVRLEGCGVCASNVPPWEGRPWFQYPMAGGALGHEGWGSVVEVGEGVDETWLDRRVALLSQSAYAEYDLAPVSALVPLPADLRAQPFPGEPLGCALNIFARSGIEAGMTVAVVGLGFLGLLLVELATNAGAKVLGIGRRVAVRDLALQRGAVEVAAPGEALATAQRVTDGRLCDVVIEAAGHQEPLDLAGELTAERGRLVIAGYHQDGLRTVNLQMWNWRGLDVTNAHERDPSIYIRGMERAVEAVRTRRLSPAPLYTHRFSLEQLGEALRLTAERPDGFVKALITL